MKINIDNSHDNFRKFGLFKFKGKTNSKDKSPKNFDKNSKLVLPDIKETHEIRDSPIIKNKTKQNFSKTKNTLIIKKIPNIKIVPKIKPSRKDDFLFKKIKNKNINKSYKQDILGETQEKTSRNQLSLSKTDKKGHSVTNNTRPNKSVKAERISKIDNNSTDDNLQLFKESSISKTQTQFYFYENIFGISEIDQEYMDKIGVNKTSSKKKKKKKKIEIKIKPMNFNDMVLNTVYKFPIKFQKQLIKVKQMKNDTDLENYHELIINTVNKKFSKDATMKLTKSFGKIRKESYIKNHVRLQEPMKRFEKQEERIIKKIEICEEKYDNLMKKKHDLIHLNINKRSCYTPLTSIFPKYNFRKVFS